MQYLEKLCYFFLFARILLHMCPNETYEKYFSVLVEWIAIGMLILPLLSGELYEESLLNWQKQWELAMGASFEETISQLNEEAEQVVQETVEETVAEESAKQEQLEQEEKIE